MVPRRMEVQVTSGSVTLDFTEAVTWWPSLQLEVAVRGGSLRLVTKPGILVSTDDLQIRASGVNVRVPPGPEVPVRFRIEVSGKVASGSLTARPPPTAPPDLVAMAAATPLALCPPTAPYLTHRPAPGWRPSVTSWRREVSSM
jgi:hypothetical protein